MATAGTPEERALVAEARTQLPPPFDAMVPLGEMDIYLSLENADGIEATLPAVEAFITNSQYEIVRPAPPTSGPSVPGKRRSGWGADRRELPACSENRCGYSFRGAPSPPALLFLR